MSKLAFLLYYSGFCGLMVAYTVKEVWLDRVALMLLLSGCWLHARFWAIHIESITAPVQSLVAALDLINKQRKDMDFFIRWLPNLFLSRESAKKNEYRFIRLTDKSLSQAVRSHVNNNWEIIPMALCLAIPASVYGIGQFKRTSFSFNPIFHDFMVHFCVLVFTPLMSVGLTMFLVFHLLRK